MTIRLGEDTPKEELEGRGVCYAHQSVIRPLMNYFGVSDADIRKIIWRCRGNSLSLHPANPDNPNSDNLRRVKLSRGSGANCIDSIDPPREFIFLPMRHACTRAPVLIRWHNCVKNRKPPPPKKQKAPATIKQLTRGDQLPAANYNGSSLMINNIFVRAIRTRTRQRYAFSPIRTKKQPGNS